ncbi:AbiJ-NTD4 domain-containing protein [Shimia biformata]|uniref:AbiJ-NTD4 domain-containing protein n=1 Tax=Shimia biformata TaxID=1294299 RepID=UPI0019519E0A|nr:hypothetical protein [Shimia biformata]
MRVFDAIQFVGHDIYCGGNSKIGIKIMTRDSTYVPFSQREGFEPIPTQLQIGEVSGELRRLIDYFIRLEIERESHSGYESTYFDPDWARVAKDFHVLFLKLPASSYSGGPYEFRKLIENWTTRLGVGRLFDMVEFFVRHQNCSAELKRDLASAFETSLAAYRVVDRQIVAIGNEQQAEAFMGALKQTEKTGASASRQHLVAAGKELVAANWAGSVRESIHAVEAMAVKLAPERKTLGAALDTLSGQAHLHGGLKAAFKALYGWSSDEEGVRHALVFNNEAKVDEADALFMLGACASFVSYLIARSSGP